METFGVAEYIHADHIFNESIGEDKVKNDLILKWRITFFATGLASLAGGSFCAELWDPRRYSLFLDVCGNLFMISLICSIAGILGGFIYEAWKD